MTKIEPIPLDYGADQRHYATVAVLARRTFNDPEIMGVEELIERIAQRVVQLLKTPTDEPST